MALQAQFLDALLEAALERISTLPRLLGVQPRWRTPGPLLEAQFLRAVVPVVDLLGQAVLDRRFRLVDALDRATAYVCDVSGDDGRDGMSLSLGL